ncbi:hypothetical protein [Hyphomicrobium sp. ghe19]|uniref:hypothetical protein n=1 Tax=Hyphomicrobium sp. ghe19 TaxID=2682968 RepID=UPI0013677758|nr:hypothetical protein HYPP_01947 [Hyphomicrobium sp. ghe19]
MANVIAKARGYFGGVLREAGERFSISDDIMKDDKRRPSWVKLAAFGGNGDHDGNGTTGGSVAPAAGGSDVGAGDAAGGSAADTAADVDDGKGKAGKVGKAGKAGRAGKAKVETVDAPTAEPFADAPEPVRVENEIDSALGRVQPDWIAPGSTGETGDDI